MSDPAIFAAVASAAPLRQKQRFTESLRAGETVTDCFLVKAKEIRLNKNNEPYVTLVLGDRTGEFDAKIWDQVQELQALFERDDIVKVQGKLTQFRNRLQMTVQRVRRLEAREYELSDYLPSTAQDVEALYAELRGYAEAVGNRWLRQLLLTLLDDPELARRFKRAPAAKTLHHAYLGGLLEHVLSLCRAARRLLPNYPGLDGDVVLAGIVLHDLGKIEELSYERSIAYTTPGQLLGHMVLGLFLLREKIAAIPGFPLPLAMALEHMIVSHHGQYEFGSPKLPMFPEALLLHYLDDLDSKLHSMQASLRLSGEAEWTNYNPSLERPLLNLQAWLTPAATAPEES